jgi:hypothetical protein
MPAKQQLHSCYVCSQAAAVRTLSPPHSIRGEHVGRQFKCIGEWGDQSCLEMQNKLYPMQYAQIRMATKRGVPCMGALGHGHSRTSTTRVHAPWPWLVRTAIADRAQSQLYV